MQETVLSGIARRGGSIVATQTSKSRVATVGIEAMSFHKPVFVGDEVFAAKPQVTAGPSLLGLGRAYGRLHVLDVSDITKPREVAWYEPRDGGTHNVWVAGDTLYLGDTARVPYGTKSAETVTQYSLRNARFLASLGIDLLVVACNTVSVRMNGAIVTSSRYFCLMSG